MPSKTASRVDSNRRQVCPKAHTTVSTPFPPSPNDVVLVIVNSARFTVRHEYHNLFVSKGHGPFLRAVFLLLGKLEDEGGEFSLQPRRQ